MVKCNLYKIIFYNLSLLSNVFRYKEQNFFTDPIRCTQ